MSFSARRTWASGRPEACESTLPPRIGPSRWHCGLCVAPARPAAGTAAQQPSRRRRRRHRHGNAKHRCVALNRSTVPDDEPTSALRAPAPSVVRGPGAGNRPSRTNTRPTACGTTIPIRRIFDFAGRSRGARVTAARRRGVAVPATHGVSQNKNPRREPGVLGEADAMSAETGGRISWLRR